MTVTQAKRAKWLHTLHEGPGALVITTVRDAGAIEAVGANPDAAIVGSICAVDGIAATAAAARAVPFPFAFSGRTESFMR